MRDRLRHVWRHASHPLRSLWTWAKSPERALRRAQRWEALKNWAANHKRNAVTVKDELTWGERRKVYAKREKRAREKARREHPTQQTGCGGLGSPDWGGGASIGEREVVPVYARYGVPVTSRKRAANHPLSLSNPSSDHNEANTGAYAVDGGTYSGEPVARAVAVALGISGYSTGNYNSYYITRCGKRFRVQILWAVSGHFNHVHVGIRLA